MGFARYRPEELPAALARTVRWRWPRERLLAVVPCEAEWPELRMGWGGHVEDTNSAIPYREATRVEDGLLGVTESRILFRGRSRPGLGFRVAAAVFGLVALVSFLAGDAPLGVLGAGALSAASWLGARTAEALGTGSGVIEFGRILEVDRQARRIRGLDGWGIQYRIRLSDRDLDQVLGLLPG